MTEIQNEPNGRIEDLGNWDFGFVSDFEFRASDLRCR
jgi:hypothetical protein